MTPDDLWLALLLTCGMTSEEWGAAPFGLPGTVSAAHHLFAMESSVMPHTWHLHDPTFSTRVTPDGQIGRAHV